MSESAEWDDYDIHEEEFDHADIDMSDIGLDDPDEFDPIEYSDDPDSDTPVDVNERMMLSYLVANPNLWIRCSPILKPEYFTDDYADVLKMVQAFEQRTKRLPDKSVVTADTGISLDTISDAMEPAIVDEITNRIEEYCRYKAATEFLVQSADIIDEDKTKSTMDFLLKEMEQVVRISAHQDLGYEVHADVKELLAKAENADGLPTGYHLLDEPLGGGVTNPSYNLISAASGQGKSIMMQNLSVNYARQGHNVVYITLELPEFMIEKRFAAMMTDTPINSIYHNLDSVITKMKLSSRREGKIQVKRFPMTGTSVAELRSYLHELKSVTGEEWDHIMIDYPDLMKPMRTDIRADNIHIKDQAVSEEIYEWAHEPGSSKVIWGASQQVKGAKDEKDARQSGVAGGVGKVHTCDVLLILKRTREDQQAEQTWGYIEKGRNGGGGMRVPFRWDGQTQRITTPEEMRDLYEEANSAESSQENGSKEAAPKKSKDPLVRAKEEAEKPESKKATTALGRIRKRREGIK